MLAAAGHFVWMLPENNAVGKNPDAIIDGLIYDFKQVKFVILGSDVRRFDFDEI